MKRGLGGIPPFNQCPYEISDKIKLDLQKAIEVACFFETETVTETKTKFKTFWKQLKECHSEFTD